MTFCPWKLLSIQVRGIWKKVAHLCMFSEVHFIWRNKWANQMVIQNIATLQGIFTIEYFNDTLFEGLG